MTTRHKGLAGQVAQLPKRAVQCCYIFPHQAVPGMNREVPDWNLQRAWHITRPVLPLAD